MYKVFIDHKPIIFVKDEELSTEFPFVQAAQINNFREAIGHHLAKADLQHPLQIVCVSVDDEFKRCFEGYELIEAAGGIVQSEFGYLVIKRNGLWDLPKGKMEKDENREQAAIREIEEECGINNPEISGFITETYHTFFSHGDAILKKTYWYYLSYSGSKNVQPQHEEGITRVDWMSEKELFRIRENTYGSINEVLAKFKKKYLTD